MSEKKKEKKFVKVESTGTSSVRKTAPEVKAARSKSAAPKRILACVFWLLAIVAEVLAILVVVRKFYVPDDKMLMWILIFLGIDLVMVIVGSQFWKRANDIDPASSSNKVKFFLWNQMGLIVACLAFFPVVIILLMNKQLDGKTKKIATAAAVVGLLVSGLASIDYDPISAEERNAAEAQYDGATVYWTRFGKKYHLYSDCQSFHASDEIFMGEIKTAMDAGRTSLCAFCKARQDAGEAFK